MHIGKKKINKKNTNSSIGTFNTSVPLSGQGEGEDFLVTVEGHSKQK
jgi:hypothetical protein